MEADKRKRIRKEENDERKNNKNNNNNKRKKQKQQVIEKVEKEEKAATEEEVEEFFAILRRIQVAVDYFGGEGWRAAAEAGVAYKGTDEDKEEETIKVKEGINNGVLDLNAVPEAERDSQSH